MVYVILPQIVQAMQYKRGNHQEIRMFLDANTKGEWIIDKNPLKLYFDNNELEETIQMTIGEYVIISENERVEVVSQRVFERFFIPVFRM